MNQLRPLVNIEIILLTAILKRIVGVIYWIKIKCLIYHTVKIKFGNYIINLENSNGSGTHWTSLFYHPLNSYYFDSYGFVAPLEVEQKIKPYKYNDAEIQDFNSKACGYYALAFIKFLNDKTNKEVAFKEFLRLFKDNTKENDNILKQIYKFRLTNEF